MGSERWDGGNGNLGDPPRSGGLRRAPERPRPITGEEPGSGREPGGSRRRPWYRLSRRDNRTRGEGRAAASFMRHVQGRAGECHSWLGPPSRTKSENCSERFTGRPRPIPGEGSTRSMTRSTAGTSWSGRGSWCAPIAARPASTGRPSPMSSGTGSPDCSTSWPRICGRRGGGRCPRAGCSSRSPDAIS